jgi:hypothetical protein
MHPPTLAKGMPCGSAAWMIETLLPGGDPERLRKDLRALS